MPTDKADIFTQAMFGKFNIFRKRFDKESINQESESGGSLLHYAISGRNYEISLLLIDNDIDVNIKDSNGQTALHYICVNQDINVAKALLQKDIDINIRDKYGNNAMWTAVFNCKGKNYELVELLMEYNPDVLTKNNAGRSPIDFAKQIGDKRLLEILDYKE